MAFPAIDNTRVNAAKHIDDWYAAEVVAGKEIPYASVAAACLAIPSAVRMKGRSCIVTIGGLTLEYWWKDDLTDAGLIPKSAKNDSLIIGSWGDSLTFGTGSTTGNSYPELLSLETGLNFFNGGVPGDTSTQIRARFIAGDVKNKQAVIIWAGRNNYPDLSGVMADIAAMVANLNGRPFIVVSVLNGDYSFERVGEDGYQKIMAVNNALQSTYPNNYVDVRAFLVSLYNPSLAQDVIDHGYDMPPTSLRSDVIHLNDKGYRKVADFFKRHILKVMGDGVSSPNLLEAQSLRITGFSAPTPQYGTSVEAFLVGLQGYIGAFNRTSSLPIPFNIQSYVNAITNINALGGKLNIGGDAAYTNVYIKNGDLVLEANANNAYATIIENKATTDAHGLFVRINQASNGVGMLIYKGTVFLMGVDNAGNLSVKGTLNASGVSEFRTIGLAGLSLGSASATRSLIQSRDATVNQELQLTAKYFDFDSGNVGIGFTADQGVKLAVNGKATIAIAPTNPNDVVRLTELTNTTNLSATKKTALITPTVGATTVTIPVLINQFVNFVVKSGIVYLVAATANEDDLTVSFNSATGVITFATPFVTGEKVWANYQGVSGTSGTSNIITVQNYTDIVLHSTWGGSAKTEYYVLTDNQNMGGKKGAYVYIPNFTLTPAQIAINFND